MNSGDTTIPTYGPRKFSIFQRKYACLSKRAFLSRGLAHECSPLPLYELSMSMALSLAHSTLFSKTSFFLCRNGVRTFSCSIHFASSSLHYSTFALPTDKPRREKWRQQVVAVLEVGGVKISKDGRIPASIPHFVISVGRIFTFYL